MALQADSHDDIELLSPPPRIHRLIIPSFHPDRHLQPMRNSDICLLVLRRKVNHRSTVWDRQVLLQMPRTHRIEQRRIHVIIMPVHIERIRCRVTESSLKCQGRKWRLACSVGVIGKDRKEGDSIELLGLLDEEQEELLGHLVSSYFLVLSVVVVFLYLEYQLTFKSLPQYSPSRPMTSRWILHFIRGIKRMVMGLQLF